MASCGEREETRQFRYLCVFICVCSYLPIVFSCIWVQMCLLNSPHKKVMASGGERKPDMFFIYLSGFIFVYVSLAFVFSCLWVQMCLLNSPHKKVMASGGERKPDKFFCAKFSHKMLVPAPTSSLQQLRIKMI